jgi:heme O synthase-like polyprenyltransferase
VKLGTALRLGRVSNLPTTWTNVAAGLVLSGAAFERELGLWLCLCVSCFYVGGMYLNDAFDRGYDARERPERPIPSGEVRASTVFAVGFSLLFAGVAGVSALALREGGTGWPPVLAALSLALVIVFYDLHHKGNPWSPVVMACNRVLVYLVAALSARAGFGVDLLWGSLALLCYLIGLTYVAKQENLRELGALWPLAFLAVPFTYLRAFAEPVAIALYLALALYLAFSLRFLFDRGRRDVKRAVTLLIAGISLLDALLVASHGHALLAAACVLGTVATLLLQRHVPGT